VWLDRKAVVGLHSYNTSNDSSGCANANTTTRAVRLRDKVGWIESIAGKCKDVDTSSGAQVKRCDESSSAPMCDGSWQTQDAAQWDGCRGSGCWVCTDSMVKDYPRYFKNHPTCVSNSTCAGTFGRCSVNCPKPTDFDKAKWNTGLEGQYYFSTTPSPESDFRSAYSWRTDGVIDFNWGTGSPIAGWTADNFSVRWVGWVLAPSAGQYVFQTESDDGIRVWLNGQMIVDNWTDHGPTLNNSASVTLLSGSANAIKIEYYEKGGGSIVRLRWKAPGSSSFVTVPKANLSR
jgi:hypothetical protein